MVINTLISYRRGGALAISAALKTDQTDFMNWMPFLPSNHYVKNVCILSFSGPCNLILQISAYVF